MNPLIPTIFILIIILTPVSVNALEYDNGVPHTVHNCMKAVPRSFTSQEYDYVPCDNIQTIPSNIYDKISIPTLKNDASGIQNVIDCTPTLQVYSPEIIGYQVSLKGITTNAQYGYVDWGDGNRDNFPVNSHTYTNSGNYQINVQVWNVCYGRSHGVEVSNNVVIYPQNSSTQSRDTPNSINQSNTPNSFLDINWSWIVGGLVIAVLVVLVAIAVRRGNRSRPNYFTPPTNVRIRDTFETPVRRSDGTTQFVETRTPISDEFLQYVRDKYSRDYERILKWIAKYPEDVKKILQNSEDYRNQIRELARRAREEQDWSDLK